MACPLAAGACSDYSESEGEEEEGAGGAGGGGDDESLPGLEPNVGDDLLPDADTGTEFGLEVRGAACSGLRPQELCKRLRRGLGLLAAQHACKHSTWG